MAKALAADAKSAAKPAKLDKPAARELASLREEVRALAEAQARSGTGRREAGDADPVDAKAFASLRQDLKTLVDEHYALAARAEDRVATAAFDCERAAATNARKTDALEDAFAAFARETGDIKRDLERSFQTHAEETNRRIESWRGKPLVSKSDVELEVERALALAASNRSDAANRVDYALFSGGGRVVGHSALSPLVARAEGPLTHALKSIRGGVHPRADEWVLSGGFNEPNAGECLALRGDRGHVDVRLREAVFVNAVTVEHVRGDVAYDLSSAPKVLAVLGWNRTREPPAFSEKGDMERSAKSLHDFTHGGEYLRYELKSSELSRGAAQTFAFHATRARAVDHVRFEVRSNYGNAEYTCLYRLRVHGAPVAKPAKVEYD
jgi:SUN domain-containing protein 1/2